MKITITKESPNPCLLFVGKTSNQGSFVIVPADKSKWSDSSKNSFSYDSCIEYYADISYTCYKCQERAVFTAEDQKEAFEVRKCYIWQRRTLCPCCYESFNILKAEIKEFESLWSGEDDLTKEQAPYITEWLAALRQVPKYGKPSNQAMIESLAKMAGKNA